MYRSVARFGSILCLIFVPFPVWAIPSPDVVVNLFASAAQLLGLSTVVLGAGALGRFKKNNQRAASKKWSRLFWGSVLLLFFSIAANILQFTWQQDKSQQRLQTNLWRSSTEAGQKVGDVNLKTLKFSDQIDHPLGIQTDTLSDWINNGTANGQPLNIIDVRETEERELGYISGSSHSRYPDTRSRAAELLKKDHVNVLTCYSGNRSSELCAEFAKLGLPCQFLIGGYEKWIAENRPLVGITQTNSVLRGLPAYQQENSLLDTPVVQKIVNNEQGIFVDVRYPGDFDRGHLPNAINLPIRKLASNDIQLKLDQLPRQPIIAACYDKRSCFYAKILGLKLTRLGYDYRGRYTVPHEYALPRADKEYVQSWKSSQEGYSLFRIGLIPLQSSLSYLHNATSSLTLSIFLLVITLRLLFVPISIKSDWDSSVQRSLNPEINALKDEWQHDKQRLSKLLFRIYKRENLTPGKNFLGTLIQLVFFILFFSAVNNVATGVTESFLWLTELGQPDPFYILPLVIGTMVYIICLKSSSNRTYRFLLLYAFAGALLFVMTAPLNAAVNIYLTLSLLFVLLQKRVVDRWLKKKRRLTHIQCIDYSPQDSAIVSLEHAQFNETVGNKAARLSIMKSQGLPVPNGIVITDKLLRKIDMGKNCTTRFSTFDANLILADFDQLQASDVAVRSTALAEDNADQSFAGVFDSVLNVNKGKLLDAIYTVRNSYSNGCAKAYSDVDDHTSGSVLIQAMVDAEFAGVMFTEHPNNSGKILIELVEGLGESLVSGVSIPEYFEFGRASLQPADASVDAPIDLGPLIKLGREIEQLFGQSQDIEWAYHSGEYHILQSRDITASCMSGSDPKSVLENERCRILTLDSSPLPNTEDSIFVQNELSEMLPRPTPFSLSLMGKLWEVGGATDMACSELGIPYEVHNDSVAYIETLYGALYVNQAEGKRRFHKSPGAIASFQLTRQADELEQAFYSDFLPTFVHQQRLRESLDFTRFSSKELLDLAKTWINEFVSETYIHAERINIAADFYLKTACRLLEKRDLDPSSYLGHGPETIMHQAMAMLAEIRNGDRPLQDFKSLFGHRAVHDYEISEARYQEDDALILPLVAHAVSITLPESKSKPVPNHKLTAVALERAQRFQSLKEDAKHHVMRAVATLRALLLAIDQRFELTGDIFYLRCDELDLLDSDDGVAQAKKQISNRLHQENLFNNITLPSKVTLGTIEAMNFDVTGKLLEQRAADRGRLQGTRVSGDQEVTGIVHVVDTPDKLNEDEFEEGNIIVTRFTDPQWIPLFPKAGGFIGECGGWLSHMTIVAREHNLPCIVGVEEITCRLQTGQKIRLCADGFIDRRTGEQRRQLSSSCNDDQRSSDRREVRGTS